jgi:hypothetical protein
VPELDKIRSGEKQSNYRETFYHFLFTGIVIKYSNDLIFRKESSSTRTFGKDTS